MDKPKHYLYKITNVKAEMKPIHYPKMKPLSTTTNNIVQTNNALFAGNYDVKNVIIWMPIFFPYEHVFLMDLKKSMSLRKPFLKRWQYIEEYIIYLYHEYVAWLSFMKTIKLSKNTNLKPLKKYYVQFFSTYNNVYFRNSKKQKHIRYNTYSLNPLIKYWFDCQELQRELLLPNFTIFLPYISLLWKLLGDPSISFF